MCETLWQALYTSWAWKTSLEVMTLLEGAAPQHRAGHWRKDHLGRHCRAESGEGLEFQLLSGEGRASSDTDGNGGKRKRKEKGVGERDPHKEGGRAGKDSGVFTE